MVRIITLSLLFLASATAFAEIPATPTNVDEVIDAILSDINATDSSATNTTETNVTKNNDTKNNVSENKVTENNVTGNIAIENKATENKQLRDPTAPLGWKAGRTTSTKTENKQYRPTLQSIMCKTQNSCQAIIDSKTLSVGQSVRGYKATSIKSNRVTLTRGSEVLHLELFSQVVKY